MFSTFQFKTITRSHSDCLGYGNNVENHNIFVSNTSGSHSDYLGQGIKHSRTFQNVSQYFNSNGIWVLQRLPGLRYETFQYIPECFTIFQFKWHLGLAEIAWAMVKQIPYVPERLTKFSFQMQSGSYKNFMQKVPYRLPSETQNLTKFKLPLIVSKVTVALFDLSHINIH